MEEEAAKRIEALVKKRVEEELEARREEIEAEVARRVEEAKAAMEAELRAEMEARRQELIAQEKRREVMPQIALSLTFSLITIYFQFHRAKSYVLYVYQIYHKLMKHYNNIQLVFYQIKEKII